MNNRRGSRVPVAAESEVTVHGSVVLTSLRLISGHLDSNYT